MFKNSVCYIFDFQISYNRFLQPKIFEIMEIRNSRECHSNGTKFIPNKTTTI